MRNAIIGGVALLALSAGAGWAQTLTPSSPKVAAQFAKAKAQSDAGDNKAAHKTLAGLTTSREFLNEPPETRGGILALDARVANELGLTGYAAIAIRSASRLPGQAGLVAQIDVYNAVNGGYDEEANARRRRALMVLATQYPDTLNATPDRIILLASGRPASDPASEAEEQALAEVLLGNWKPRDPFQVTDFLKLAVIRKRLADRRVDEAREMVSGLESPYGIQLLRMDRRYDGLFAGGWTPLTPRRNNEAQLVRLRALRAEHPRWLYGVTREVEYLRALRADAEGLEVIDAALAQASRSPESFEDTADRLPWLRETRGKLLGRLKGPAAEIEGRRQAAATAELGQPNVSSVLNLAGYLVDDDPKEALRLVRLASERGSSSYGRGVGLKVSVCAHQALGQTAQAQSEWRTLAGTHEPGFSLLTLDAALCLGDADGAAKAVIGALGSVDERPRAIDELQVDMPDPDPPRTEAAKARKTLKRAVVQRADVQTAFAPYGHMITLAPDEVWRP